MVKTKREWFSVAQFLVRHGGQIGRSAIYERIREGSLPSIRIGRKVLIPSDAFDTILEEQRAKGTK